MNQAKIISLWSNLGRQNGVSCHTAIITNKIAKQFPNLKILTLDTNFRFAVLQHLLRITGKTLDNALNLCITNSLTKEKFCEVITKVDCPNGNIYNINASMNHIFNTMQEKEGIDQIIEVAKEMFDLIIVDNGAGINSISSVINKKANLVLNFLSQNKQLLDDLVSTNQIQEVKNDKFINVLNRYSESKGIDIKTIKKIYQVGTLEKIEYSNTVWYAINSKDISYVEDDLIYMEDIENLIEKVLLKLEYINEEDIKKKVNLKKGNPFLGLFKKRGVKENESLQS